MATHGELACIFVLTTLYWNLYHLRAQSLESFAEAKWPNHGGGIENRREARHEHKISPHTLAKLQKKWSTTTSGDVTATPAIANGMVYFPTWTGDVYAVKQKDGKLVWRRNLTDLVGSKSAILSRHTPVVENEYLLVGTYLPGLQLALNINTGDLIWSKLLDSNPYACITMSGSVYKGYRNNCMGSSLGGYDTWTAACIVNGPTSPNCPPIVGPDYDFGEVPMMLTVKRHTIGAGTEDGECIDIVAAGQRSGIFWTLDRNDGTLVWDAETGPGSAAGGSMWGAATDGQRFFTNVGNYYKENFTLLPSNEVTTSGGWVSINASSGQILWSTASPDGSIPYGPLSVVNGLVLTTSLGSPNGTVYALDTKSGKVLWHYNVIASMTGGVSISNGCIYFGEGIAPTIVGTFTNYTFGRAIDAICVT